MSDMITTQPTTRPATRRGFTLLEVLIALAIASLTLVTALATISTGQRNIAMVQLETRASMLARAKLSELEAAGYPDPDPDKALNAGAELGDLVWIEEGEFVDEEELDPYEESGDDWRADFYWQVIIETPPNMKGIRMVTVRIFSKQYRANKQEARWPDYIEEDYRLLVEVVTYRAAHFYAESEVE
jgi:prepilin-type N-terminal cleavage/methylation domain-containing protein